jgi:catechol 2,3-dioxygenase-like lactoylglutathione lyase family enzyme
MAVSIGNRILPCLLVADMRVALDFYIEKLGFVQTGYYPIESEPIRTEVRRDDVAIIFYTETVHLRFNDSAPACTGAFYIFPENLDALVEELRDKVEFAWGPEITENGVREFAIRDPSGYVLVFAERA